jgi:protein-S-isoprenylcysteine O-methyltransferase Ste14
MKQEQRDDMTTQVLDAELEVARSRQRLQDSLQLAGETGSRLAEEMRRKAAPAVIVAVVVGGAVVAGAAFMAARGAPRRRWRGSNQASATGILARAVGVWLLRAAALRLAEALTAKFRDSAPSALGTQSELQ